MQARWGGHIGTVNVLLDAAGADVNIQWGLCLRLAIRQDNADLTTLLLNKGAVAKAKPHETGLSAFKDAHRRRRYGLVHLIRQHYVKRKEEQLTKERAEARKEVQRQEAKAREEAIKAQQAEEAATGGGPAVAAPAAALAAPVAAQ